MVQTDRPFVHTRNPAITGGDFTAVKRWKFVKAKQNASKLSLKSDILPIRC